MMKLFALELGGAAKFFSSLKSSRMSLVIKISKQNEFNT